MSCAKLHELYSRSNNTNARKSWRMKWIGYMSSTGKTINANKRFVTLSKGKRPLCGPRLI
jgi:hypothetical protein